MSGSKAATKSKPISVNIWEDQDGTIQIAGGDLKIVSISSDGSKPGGHTALYAALSEVIRKE